MKTRQDGFTLVEIAVVLVIIGLLLGGVLKGQELIGSARVKNLAQDLRSVPAMIYAYQDKYRALPGDHKTASTLVDGTALNGNGNGLLEGAWNTNAAADESCRFWQHLRLAHLASGADKLATENCDILPANALGGKMGIESVSPNQAAYIKDLKGSYLCSGGIPGKYVAQLDQTLDNGDPATGSMRAVADGADRGTAAIAATGLVESATYTVCLQY